MFHGYFFSYVKCLFSWTFLLNYVFASYNIIHLSLGRQIGAVRLLVQVKLVHGLSTPVDHSFEGEK